jgi:hypothetical protein
MAKVLYSFISRQRGIAEVDEKAKLQDQDLITFSVILQGTAGRLWL